MTTEIQHIEWGAYKNLTQPGVEGIAELSASNLGEVMPWQVPAGKVYRITDMHFASKHVVWPLGPERASYMHIVGGPTLDTVSVMYTVTELGPNVNLSGYLEVPSGWWLQVDFCNNSQEVQNMNGFLVGYLTAAGS